jgi:hypothetical protein
MTKRNPPTIYEIFDNPANLLIYIEIGGWIRYDKYGCFLYKGSNLNIGTKIPVELANILKYSLVIELDSGNFDYGERFYHFNVNAYEPPKKYTQHPLTRNNIIKTLKDNIKNMTYEEKKIYIKQHRIDKLKRILK